MNDVIENVSDRLSKSIYTKHIVDFLVKTNMESDSEYDDEKTHRHSDSGQTK